MANQVGEKILIPADAALGTSDTTATILEVTDYGYEVSLDSDPFNSDYTPLFL